MLDDPIQPTTNDPGFPVQQDPPSAPVQADQQKGDGVVDPPVDPDESSFVLDMFDNIDAPSAEDLLAESGIVQDLPGATPAPAPQQPQPQGQPQSPAAAQPVPAGQPQETVIQQQVQPAAQPVAGQQTPQGQPAGTPGQGVPQAPVQGQGPAQPAPGGEIEALRAAVEAQRENFINVAARSYAETFTDEDVEEFQANPKVALSKMGARLHFDIVQNTLGMLSAQLPKMMSGMVAAHKASSQQEDVFYTANPDLRDHDSKIRPIAQMYRQLNPNMPAQEFMNGLAAMARMQLGLQAPAPQQPVTPTPQPVAQPQRAPAFRPAGAAVPAQQPPASGQTNGQVNQWGFMDMILEADADGRLDGRF